MKINSVLRLRNSLIRFTSGEISPVRSFLVRNWIFLTLLLITVPWIAAREIAHGKGPVEISLKDSLRITMWLWNRSWIPMQQPLHTYFDIGWILSEESCEALLSRGFLRKNPLNRQCDIAQYRLSSIRSGFSHGNKEKLDKADREIQSLVDSIFGSAQIWLAERRSKNTSESSSVTVGIPEASGPAGDFDNSGTRAALLSFDDLCSELGQEYFLISGTFLGIVRDGAFISNDHDIDIGITEDLLLNSLIPSLKNHPDFIIRKVDQILKRKNQAANVNYELMKSPAIIQVAHRSGALLDIFTHFHEGEVVWHGDSMHRWDNQPFELSEYEFLGRKFKAPSNPEPYLVENYGPDWKIPKTDFDSMVDTPNMRFAGSANSLVFWAWMVASVMEQGDAERVGKYLKLLDEQGVLAST